jgi:hypothetical protein
VANGVNSNFKCLQKTIENSNEADETEIITFF